MKIAHIALVVLLTAAGRAQESKPVAASAGVLSVAETQRLMPPAVFFQGQLATVQMRNSFGARFTTGGLVLAGMVDTGGYSSALRDKYQFYLLSDTAFEIEGKKFSPGSYGCGFGQGGLGMDTDSIHRVMSNRITGAYFGYDLRVVASGTTAKRRL